MSFKTMLLGYDNNVYVYGTCILWLRFLKGDGYELKKGSTSGGLICLSRGGMNDHWYVLVHQVARRFADGQEGYLLS